MILDGYWKLKFRYWFLWRWFYYIRQYDNEQLQPLLDAGKKKVPLTQFLLATMSLTEARATLTSMRTEEVERILQQRATVQQEETEKPASQVGNRRYARGRAYVPDRFTNPDAAAEATEAAALESEGAASIDESVAEELLTSALETAETAASEEVVTGSEETGATETIQE